MLNVTVHIRDVCVFLAPVFSGLTAISTFLLTRELWNQGAGLLAACFIAIVPGYISRSVAGSFDNEGIAIFALQFTYYLWVSNCWIFCFGNVFFGSSSNQMIFLSIHWNLIFFPFISLAFGFGWGKCWEVTRSEPLHNNAFQFITWKHCSTGIRLSCSSSNNDESKFKETVGLLSFFWFGGIWCLCELRLDNLQSTAFHQLS